MTQLLPNSTFGADFFVCERIFEWSVILVENTLKFFQNCAFFVANAKPTLKMTFSVGCDIPKSVSVFKTYEGRQRNNGELFVSVGVGYSKHFLKNEFRLATFIFPHSGTL